MGKTAASKRMAKPTGFGSNPRRCQSLKRIGLSGPARNDDMMITASKDTGKVTWMTKAMHLETWVDILLTTAVEGEERRRNDER